MTSLALHDTIILIITIPYIFLNFSTDTGTKNVVYNFVKKKSVHLMNIWYGYVVLKMLLLQDIYVVKLLKSFM